MNSGLSWETPLAFLCDEQPCWLAASMWAKLQPLAGGQGVMDAEPGIQQKPIERWLSATERYAFPLHSNLAPAKAWTKTSSFCSVPSFMETVRRRLNIWPACGVGERCLYDPVGTEKPEGPRWAVWKIPEFSFLQLEYSTLSFSTFWFLSMSTGRGGNQMSRQMVPAVWCWDGHCWISLQVPFLPLIGEVPWEDPL